MDFVVTIDNAVDIQYEIFDTSIAKNWFNLFCNTVSTCEFDHKECFHNYNNESELLNGLTDAGHIINNYVKKKIIVIPENFTESHEEFNRLHGIFEELNQNAWKSVNAFIDIAPQEVRDAVRIINSNIHSLERQPYKKRNILNFDFDKEKYTRKPFIENDYNYFEFKRYPNTLYITYCEVGKDLIALYKDKLTPDYEGAVNKKHFTGDAISWFAQDTFFHREDWSIFPPGFEGWCRRYNIDYTDKRLVIGELPVAKIINNVDDSNFSSISKITNVEIL